ncbi:hypothetical protein ACFVTY_03200 [Streptomyces sp. NPDC058067]|uniref:hypothetical protein n=1 Tax=Streptomyces sp. NPDC058067 TaxID=3346324 RepID=UPI0036E68275
MSLEHGGRPPVRHHYLTPDSAIAFLRSYLRFTGGRIVSDDRTADGGDLGLPGQTYRRIALSSRSATRSSA